MAKKNEPLEAPGKLNHSFIAGNFRGGMIGVLDICRWCLRPNGMNKKVAACSECDMVEV